MYINYSIIYVSLSIRLQTKSYLYAVILLHIAFESLNAQISAAYINKARWFSATAINLRWYR